MIVGVINCSKDPNVTRAVLDEICSNIEEQSFLDVAPFRQTAGVRCAFYPDATGSVDTSTGKLVTSGLPPDCFPHFVFDYPEDQGELGDHFVTADGIAVLRSFWGPSRDHGGTLFEDLATTMSHEHVEASEDPYVNWWNDWPDGKTEEANEMCDRVESSSYKRPGSRVSVSNFLSPRAFRDGPGPYDFMGVLKSAWELPADGYRILRVGGPQGVAQAVFGDRYPEYKKALKKLPHSKATRRGVLWTLDADLSDLTNLTDR